MRTNNRVSHAQQNALLATRKLSKDFSLIIFHLHNYY